MRPQWDGEVLGEFDNAQQANLVVALATLMSAISERCYAASWKHGTEFVLWDAVRNGPRDWGRDRITAEDLERLSDLSRATGGWITNSFDSPARFVTATEFAELASEQGRDQS
jgi:hypothetical protein